MLATATRTHLLWWNIQFLSPLPPYVIVLFPFAAITVRHRVCVNFMGNMHTSRGTCIHIMSNTHISWGTCIYHVKHAYIMGNVHISWQTRIHHRGRAHINKNTAVYQHKYSRLSTQIQPFININAPCININTAFYQHKYSRINTADYQHKYSPLSA